MEGINETAPMEALGCILDAGQEAETEILVQKATGTVGDA
jgi:hypothetical protein